MNPQKSFPWLVIWLLLFGGKEVGFTQTNFWQQTNGPYGGEIQTLAINSEEHIWAGTTNGVFRSINNGESWTQVGLTHANVLSIAINSHGHIFVGTDSIGLFRSTDNGTNWMQANMSLPTTNSVNAIAINSHDHIFVGTDSGGIFRSIDNGEKWTSVNNGLARINWVNCLVI
jgi:ligand-binding sensor domain-containing protein